MSRLVNGAWGIPDPKISRSQVQNEIPDFLLYAGLVWLPVMNNNNAPVRGAEDRAVYVYYLFLFAVLLMNNNFYFGHTMQRGLSDHPAPHLSFVHGLEL